MGYFAFNYMAHIFETLFERKSYDWVTFSSFIKVYQKYREKYRLDDSKYSRRIRLTENFNYTVAQLDLKLVKFSDCCMIFYPLSYLRYCIWLTKITFSMSKRVKGLWKGLSRK